MPFFHLSKENSETRDILDPPRANIFTPHEIAALKFLRTFADDLASDASAPRKSAGGLAGERRPS